MELRAFNNVAYLQAGIALQFMRRHNLTPLQFVEMDKKYKLLHFLEIGYVPFHLTGDESVLDELDAIVAEQMRNCEDD
jgi:hypothetical protein